MTKSEQQTAPPLTVADSAGKGKTSENNESYGGISIKTQKANMRKSEFQML